MLAQGMTCSATREEWGPDMVQRIVQLASTERNFAPKCGTNDVSRRRRVILASILAPAITLFSECALADEGGVSFWLPGIFGSLAATPQQPGFALATMYYHTSVTAGGDVAFARQVTSGRINVNLTGTINANLKANADLGLFIPSYVVASPVLGGQLAVSMLTESSAAATPALMRH